MQIFNDCWFHVTRRGGFFGLHNHPMASWSGVYCVEPGRHDADKPDSGMLTFLNPATTERDVPGRGHRRHARAVRHGNPLREVRAGAAGAVSVVGHARREAIRRRRRADHRRLQLLVQAAGRSRSSRREAVQLPELQPGPRVQRELLRMRSRISSICSTCSRSWDFGDALQPAGRCCRSAFLSCSTWSRRSSRPSGSCGRLPGISSPGARPRPPRSWLPAWLRGGSGGGAGLSGGRGSCRGGVGGSCRGSCRRPAGRSGRSRRVGRTGGAGDCRLGAGGQ